MRGMLDDIDDRPRCHCVKSFFDKGVIIFLITPSKVMMTLNVRKPYKFELNTCEVIEIT